jgi:hypothetical protein
MTQRTDEVTYAPLGGQIIALSDVAVEQTALKPGALYELTCVGGHALCRWDTTSASAADGGFTFAVGATPVRVRCPTGNTLLNVIEASADTATAAQLCLSEIVPA